MANGNLRRNGHNMKDKELLQKIDDFYKDATMNGFIDATSVLNSFKALFNVAEICFEALSDIDSSGLAETVLEAIKKELN